MSEEDLEQSKPVVLLVDDQPRNLQLLGNALFKNGYDVALATSGQEALEQIVASPPDLVLLDVMMPGMSGFDVCRKLREEEIAPDVEVIFVTARSQKEDILEGFAVGGVDYITKPVQIPELLARVQSQISLKTARDNLRKANDELSRVVESQRRFLSILSHDVRAPIGGLDNILRDCIENEEIFEKSDLVEMIHTAADSSQRLVTFFEDALVWARMEVGGIGEALRPMAVSEAVESALSLLLPLFKRKEIEITRDIPTGAAVLGLPNGFTTVLRNLFSNAIKFSPGGARIFFSCEEGGDAWRISVRDEGVGIPPEHLETLFDADERKTTLGTEKEKGTGVGLVLCKSLVERMGGTLQVKSEVDKGTCFYFSLPKAEES